MDRAFKTGTPIWVYFIDLDTDENLQIPKLLRGFVDSEYTIQPPKINNYRYMKAEGELSGHFDMQQHTVKLYYRHKDWGGSTDDWSFSALKESCPSLWSSRWHASWPTYSCRDYY